MKNMNTNVINLERASIIALQRSQTNLSSRYQILILSTNVNLREWWQRLFLRIPSSKKLNLAINFNTGD